MARSPRLQVAGGLYHVTARGVRRSPIVLDDDDRRSFLAILARVVGRLLWRCHAYCLMTNHFHLLVETPQPDLAVGMRELNSLLARTFNVRHGLRGHAFESRYHSLLVAGEAHLLEVSRYVVLNPVRAGICRRPDDYAWSSFRATAGLAPVPPFLACQALWALFGRTRHAAQRRYRAFVGDATLPPQTRAAPEAPSPAAGRQAEERTTVERMGRASDWLREERRRTLGDWAAFCPACGHGQRYFSDGEAGLAVSCPTCGAALVSRCPRCAARIASMFAVECERCGAPLRHPEAFGSPIRRRPRR